MSPMKLFCCKPFATAQAYVPGTTQLNHKLCNTLTVAVRSAAAAAAKGASNVTLRSLATKSAYKELKALRATATTTATKISFRHLSFLTNYSDLNNSCKSLTKLNKRSFTNMTNAPLDADVFKGTVDRFRGISIDGKEENVTDIDTFSKKLNKSLDIWQKNKNRAIWFHVYKEQSHWVPILSQAGFEFHHARLGVVTMCRWLPLDEIYNIPEYAHTLLGCGGLVINEKNEVLVVSDRFAMIPNSWKLPGGYVEPKENIVDAVIREVREETGVESTFHSIVCLRHSHNGNYGCSDIYVVVGLVPTTFELKRCEREIARVQWMPVDEYLQNEDVHETNRLFVRSFLDYKNRGLVITQKEELHRVLKKPYNLYFIQPEEQQQ